LLTRSVTIEQKRVEVAMSKKVVFSIFLILAGVIGGLLILFSYGRSGGNIALTLGFLSVAIFFIMTGSVLIFSRLLDRTVNPLVEEIHKDIEDDLRDIKERRFTNTHAMIIIIGAAVILFSFFVFRFHKVEAMWGPIPVVVPTFMCMAALAWFLPRTYWFREWTDYTPMWIFLIPTCGFILSVWLGLANTENMGVLRASYTEPVSYNTNPNEGNIFLTTGDVTDFGFSGLSDCDDDVCGVILLVIGLVILTLVLVIGSAYIPHFWLLSGSILVGIMLLIAIHDLRIRRMPKEAPISG
jgi:hypothetical protein